MKKIWNRFLSLTVTALLLLFSLSSCTSAYQTLHEITKDTVTYTLEGHDGIPKRISVVSEGYVIYRLDVRPDASVGNDDACYGFYVEDANFDGHSDLIIAIKKEGEIRTYDVYLSNEKGDSFTHSKELSAISNLRVRPEYNAIFGFAQRITAREQCDTATKYIWEGGKLVPDIRVSLTYYAQQNLYCYSTALYDRTLGTFDPPRDTWLTPEEYKSTNFDFLYYYK